MTPADESFRSRLFSRGDKRETPERLVDSLADRLQDEEGIVHRVPGTETLEHTTDDGTETIQAATSGGVLALVTDRRLLFAVATESGEQVVDVPYVDVRGIDAEDGLLRSTLTVSVWNRGTYGMDVPDSDALESAVSYLDEAADVWQQVVAALQDAREATGELEKHLEAGRAGQGHEARQTVIDKLDRADDHLQWVGIETAPLERRLEGAREEFYRAEIRARLARAKTLMTEARHQTDSRAYEGAYRRYWRARDHLENALMIAIENDIQQPALIQSELERVGTRLDHLEVRPLALGKQARERAEQTKNLEDEVEAWQEAFEHYRDALTAGWGTGLDFAGDGDELRSRIESVVEKLIAARRAYADHLDQRAESHADRGELEHAQRRYQHAFEQLLEAEQFAREFRSGDPAEIRQDRHRIDSKFEAVRWKLASESID